MRPCTALFMNNGISLPREVVLPDRSAPAQVAVRVDGDRIAVDLSHAGGGAAGAVLNGRRLVLAKPVRDAAGWANGAVLSLVQDEATLRLAPTEGRDHVDFTDPRPGPDGLPLPPHYLVEAFTSHPDPEQAVAVGERIARWSLDTAARHGARLSEGGRFLDFGCGSGRVVRHVPRLSGASGIGTDLHADAIAWARMHLPGIDFLDGVLRPPLPLGDGTVDAMLALSVLTHLDAAHCDAWLREWRRILRPGGIALVTFHGEGRIESRLAAHPEHRALVERRIAEGGGLYFHADEAWAGVFPDLYQTTYHAYDHVRRVWGAIFELVEIVPASAFPNGQDMAVLRA